MPPVVIAAVGDATLAAFVAGGFSLLNVLLNWRIIRHQRQVKRDLNGATEAAESAARDTHKIADVVQMRAGDLESSPPPPLSDDDGGIERRDGDLEPDDEIQQRRRSTDP